MNIVFIGASKFGARCLRDIIALPQVNVTGIVTVQKKFSISYAKNGVNNVLYEDFTAIGGKLSIPLIVMKDKMSDASIAKQIEEWKPDLILVVGWYHMIPDAIRNIAMTTGLHASLLPDYSGGAPLVWAIINGERETGITFFVMNETVDGGPIIAQARLPIYYEDTISRLYARAEEAGLNLLREEIPKIAEGTANFVIQDEKKRRVMPQRSPEDGNINWNWSSDRIYDFIRAQTQPYPGAFTMVKGEKLTIWSSRVRSVDKNCDLGVILEHEGRSCIALSGGLLELVDIEYKGKTELFTTFVEREKFLGKRIQEI